MLVRQLALPSTVRPMGIMRALIVDGYCLIAYTEAMRAGGLPSKSHDSTAYE